MQNQSLSVGGGLGENGTYFCEIYETFVLPGSTITDDETRRFPLQHVLFPIVSVTLFTAIFQSALKPFGQITFVAQMLAGIVLGPSAITKNKTLDKQIFSHKTTTIMNLFEALGLVYMTFTLSARTDMAIIRKCGRLPILLGIVSFIFPLMVSILVANSIKDAMQLDEQLRKYLPAVASLESTISFQVILNILTDLKLVNSELGRLALSSSLISGILGVATFVSGGHLLANPKAGVKDAKFYTCLSFISMVIVIVFALRPLLIRMMSQTPEGKSLKHDHVLAINFMILGSAMFGEITGNHCLVGPLILGIATPVSPPMGCRLADKIEYIAWAVFMPCFIVNVGRDVNFFSINLRFFFAVELTIMVATMVKFLAVMVPSLYYKLPLMDALSLALLLNCRGVYDIQLFTCATLVKAITKDSFAVIFVTSIFKSAIFIPILRSVYDPSRRYVAYRRRTLQHGTIQAELRILACVNESDNVATIINVLQASNSPQSAVGVYVMKLEKYIGRSIPLVIPHRLDQLPSSHNTKFYPMIKALQQYEEENKGHVSVQCFTAIAPYATMHDDICSMALEKSTSLVIIPFQRKNNSFTRVLINKLLKLAPCSVGILFDRGIFKNPEPIFSRQRILNVCVAFIGGPDDREALAYGTRMADNHNVLVKLLRIIDVHHNWIKEKQDLDMINNFRASAIENENLEYLEETAIEGSHTVWILHSIGNDFDLILVGRRHDRDSNALLGLHEWSEIEELGVVGDVLASSDFRGKASIMVIQEQASTSSKF